MATIAITESNHSAAIEQVVGMALDSTTVSNAESALVTIRDGITAVSSQIPPSLAKRINRQVRRNRWQNNKYKCYTTAWRCALGGFLGVGIGLGLIMANGDKTLSDLFRLAPELAISLLLGSIVLNGTIGGMATMGGGFAHAYFQQVFDGRIKQWLWVMSSVITGTLLGLSMILMVQFASAANERRYLPGLLAGFLIGVVITFFSTMPKRFNPLIHSIITMLFGVVIFIVIGTTGLSLNAEPILLVVAGITTGAGFFWAFNQQSPKRLA